MRRPIVAAARQSRIVITAENHTIDRRAGLRGRRGVGRSRRCGAAAPRRHRDVFAESGSREYLFSRYGLGTQNIVDAVWQGLAINRPRAARAGHRNRAGGLRAGVDRRHECKSKGRIDHVIAAIRPHARLRRIQGALQGALQDGAPRRRRASWSQAHTNGGPIQLSVENHRSLGQMLKTVGADPKNEIMILTGSGEEFMMDADPEGFELEEEDLAYWAYEYAYKDGRINVSSLVNDLEIPTIGVLNGPGFHTEICLMCDITICSRGCDHLRSALRHRLGSGRRHPQLLPGTAGRQARGLRAADRPGDRRQDGAGIRHGQRDRAARQAASNAPIRSPTTS